MIHFYEWYLYMCSYSKSEITRQYSKYLSSLNSNNEIILHEEAHTYQNNQFYEY
jgi:hypothetical protein